MNDAWLCRLSSWAQDSLPNTKLQLWLDDVGCLQLLPSRLIWLAIPGVWKIGSVVFIPTTRYDNCGCPQGAIIPCLSGSSDPQSVVNRLCLLNDTYGHLHVPQLCVYKTLPLPSHQRLPGQLDNPYDCFVLTISCVSTAFSVCSPFAV